MYLQGLCSFYGYQQSVKPCLYKTECDFSVKFKYLYVDEVLAVLDGVDVGVVDGLHVVLDAGRPVGARAEDLRGGRRGAALARERCIQCPQPKSVPSALAHFNIYL